MYICKRTPQVYRHQRKQESLNTFVFTTQELLTWQQCQPRMLSTINHAWYELTYAIRITHSPPLRSRTPITQPNVIYLYCTGYIPYAIYIITLQTPESSAKLIQYYQHSVFELCCGLFKSLSKFTSHLGIKRSLIIVRIS